MADNNDGSKKYDGNFKEGDAASSPITLSQTILAPLDAVFQAQAHAARSFLNLVLQLGYPHRPVGDDGQPV